MVCNGLAPHHTELTEDHSEHTCSVCPLNMTFRNICGRKEGGLRGRKRKLRCFGDKCVQHRKEAKGDHKSLYRGGTFWKHD